MGTKHTAGPWKFIKNGMIVSQDETEIVGTFHKANGNEANARLIAAAPELLAELQAAEKIIIAMLNEMTIEQKFAVAEKLAGMVPDGMTRYHERRAAIAKATQS